MKKKIDWNKAMTWKDYVKLCVYSIVGGAAVWTWFIYKAWKANKESEKEKDFMDVSE